MVRRPRYNTTKSCWTQTRPVRCVVFPWCSAVRFTETGLQRRYGRGKYQCSGNLAILTVPWRSSPSSSTRSTQTWRLGWSSQTYTLHSTSTRIPIPTHH